MAVLMLVAIAVHAWLITHTVVLARDGIDFLHYEWRLEHDPWGGVLRGEAQHPGYPVAILALSTPLRHWLHGDTTNVMALSAQLVNAVAACLLVIPMYYLGRELFNRRVAFWTTLLFQCLPLSGRITSDALSEGLFLLALAWALLLSARAVKSGSVFGFALGGLWGGLAYLVRPEGALVVLATALALLVSWLRVRRPWQQTAACLASLCMAALLVGLPYAATIGGFTVKPTPKEILGGEHAAARADVSQPPAIQSAALFGIWWTLDSRHGGPGQNLRAIALEIGRGFYYVGWLAALYGLYRYRRRIPRLPAAWVTLLLCFLHAAAIYRVASVKGYVSERHVLVLVMCGLFWTVAALEEIALRLSARVRVWSENRQPSRVLTWGRSAVVWSMALPLAFAATALPRTLQSLHANEAGHRAAGRWLAAHAHADDVICDPCKWAGYYAGRAFQEDWDPSRHLDTARYVVLEKDREQHSKEDIEKQAQRISNGASIVYQWRPNARQAKQKAGEVCIYRVSAETTAP